MICPKCGANIPDDSVFCSECGTKIENNNYIICPHCHQPNQADAIYCSSCGNKIINNATCMQIIEEKKANRNGINIASLVLGIVASSITILAYTEALALVGMTIATVSLVIMAIGLLANKISGSIIINFCLAIYGLLANFIWFAYLLWMLPYF